MSITYKVKKPETDNPILYGESNPQVKRDNAYKAFTKHMQIIRLTYGTYHGNSNLKHFNEIALKEVRMYRRDRKHVSRDKKLYVSFYHKDKFIVTKSITYPSDDRKYLIDQIKANKEQIKNNIKHDRACKKSLYVKRKTIEYMDTNVNYTLIGRCFTEPNSILKIKEKFKAKIVSVSKAPKDSKNYVGVELEFFSKSQREDLGLKLYNAGLGEHVHIKGDGSINVSKSGYEAHELAILSPEDSIKEVIKRVCAVLKEDDAKINKSCGMHVHMDVRNRNRDIVFSNFVSAQRYLYAMQPKSRQENSYCKATKSKSFADANASSDRYRGVNPASVRKFGTVEIRIHSGTVDPIKINNWIEILMGIANKTEETKRISTTVEGFAKQFKLSAVIVGYIKDRIEKFKNNPDAESQGEEENAA